MRFIPYGPDANLEKSAERVGRYIDHQNKHGFGKWLVFDRESGEPIGDSGFIYLPDGKRVELGYRFAKSHWGRGLATEVATRWMEVARAWYGFDTVYAFAKPEHTASLHVMEKVGFRYLHTERLHDADVPLYAMRLPE